MNHIISLFIMLPLREEGILVDNAQIRAWIAGASFFVSGFALGFLTEFWAKRRGK